MWSSRRFLYSPNFIICFIQLCLTEGASVLQVIITYTHLKTVQTHGSCFVCVCVISQPWNCNSLALCFVFLFSQTGTNIQEHLDSITTSTQPYLLAVGRRKKQVHQFFIILDKTAISCRSASSLGAFNEMFKAHYVFATTYNPMLYNMFTFIQTTVYNIDVGKVKESPRVAEVRARMLH